MWGPLARRFFMLWKKVLHAHKCGLPVLFLSDVAHQRVENGFVGSVSQEALLDHFAIALILSHMVSIAGMWRLKMAHSTAASRMREAGVQLAAILLLAWPLIIQAAVSTGLPPGVCFWRQGILRDGELGGTLSPPDCTFQVRHQDFLKLLGPSPVVKFEVAADAHEGAVYYPDKGELYFSTTRLPGAPIKLRKFALKDKKVTTVVEDTDIANGMVLDHDGNLLVCEMGRKNVPGYIEKINLTSLHSTTVADNWFNIPFNSPNDAVVKSDKSIWFTDPDYGSVQGYAAAPRVNNQLYRIDPDGTVDVVADGFSKPNGLAFSEDERLLYVADSGYLTGLQTFDIQGPHSVTVFDVRGRTLANRRFFTSVARYDGAALGIPDGIKVDTRGNVYIATFDGIQVFDKEAQALGRIVVPGAVNMGFGGPKLDTLYILNETAILSVQLTATGAGLAYAAKYHGVPDLPDDSVDMASMCKMY